MRERWRTTGPESDQKRNNCSLAKVRFKAELRNELFDGLVVRLFGNFVARCLFFLWDALVFPFVSWIGWLMIRVFECVVSLIFFEVLYGFAVRKTSFFHSDSFLFINLFRSQDFLIPRQNLLSIFPFAILRWFVFGRRAMVLKLRTLKATSIFHLRYRR